MRTSPGTHLDERAVGCRLQAAVRRHRTRVARHRGSILRTGAEERQNKCGRHARRRRFIRDRADASGRAGSGTASTTRSTSSTRATRYDRAGRRRAVASARSPMIAGLAGGRRPLAGAGRLRGRRGQRMERGVVWPRLQPGRLAGVYRPLVGRDPIGPRRDGGAAPTRAGLVLVLPFVSSVEGSWRRRRPRPERGPSQCHERPEALSTFGSLCPRQLGVQIPPLNYASYHSTVFS